MRVLLAWSFEQIDHIAKMLPGGSNIAQKSQHPQNTCSKSPGSSVFEKDNCLLQDHRPGVSHLSRSTILRKCYQGALTSLKNHNIHKIHTPKVLGRLFLRKTIACCRIIDQGWTLRDAAIGIAAFSRGEPWEALQSGLQRFQGENLEKRCNRDCSVAAAGIQRGSWPETLQSGLQRFQPREASVFEHFTAEIHLRKHMISVPGARKKMPTNDGVLLWCL